MISTTTASILCAISYIAGMATVLFKFREEQKERKA